MFSYAIEMMERESEMKMSRVIENMKYTRKINIIYYMIFFITAIIAFFTILIGFYLAEKFKSYSTLIVWASIIIGFAMIMKSERMRDNYNILYGISFRIGKIVKNINDKIESDFLVILLWISILFLWAPLVLTVFVMLNRSYIWIAASSSEFATILESIKSIIPFLGALLGAQLTLFTFVTGSLLGRYSGNLAGVVIRHKAFISLIAFSVTGMALLSTGLLFGYPDSLLYLPNILGVLTIICMILSIIVTLRSIESDKALIYAGFRLAKIISKKMKKPPIMKNKTVPVLWRILGSVGLDWRDPDRLLYLTPPRRDSNRASKYLNTLFSAANKAIQNGEQEIYQASLSSIFQVMKAYTQKRSFYYRSDDEVFTFVNNQMAALIHSASKISNEYLITDTIKLVGLIGKLSLDIGDVRKLNTDDSVMKNMPRGHAIALHWIGLLKEGFSLSQKLVRSTGATEAQEQLLGMAIRAMKKSYDEVVLYNYLPTIGEIHTVCIMSYDGYRKVLAANNYRYLLILLFSSLTDTDSKNRHFHIAEEIIKSIEKMAKLQHKVNDVLTFDFSDIISVLIGKVSSAKATIQDIVFCLNRITWDEDWQKRESAEEVIQLVHLIKNIAIDAIKNKQTLKEGYLEAIYEIAYILLDKKSVIPYKFRKNCEKDIFVTWREMLKFCRDDNKYNLFHWEHPMFGLIGYGMLICKERTIEKEELKNELTESVKFYFNSVKEEQKDAEKRVDDSTWGYLQLLGAWTKFFLEDEILGNEILDFIINKKPYVYSTSILGGSSSDGKYGHLGYPTIMHKDFYMPWLRDIQQYLNENDWSDFEKMQAKLMSEEILFPPYEYIEKIRAPIRKKFYEEMHSRRSRIVEG